MLGAGALEKPMKAVLFVFFAFLELLLAQTATVKGIVKDESRAACSSLWRTHEISVTAIPFV